MALGTLSVTESGGGGNGAPANTPQQNAAVDAYMGAASTSAMGPSTGGGLGSAPETGRSPANIMNLINSIYGMNLINSIYGPQNQALQGSQQSLLNQLGIVDAQYQSQSGYLNSNYGLDQRNLGLDRQGLSIDRAAIARQLADTIAQEQIIRGLDANSRKSLGLQYDQDQRQERSDATARGAFTTPGTRQNLKDLFGGLMLGNERLDLGFRSDMLDLRSRRASLRDQRKQIDLQGQRYNLSGDQLRNQLNQALDQLGLSRMTSVNDIFDALNSGNSQRAALAQQMLDDLMGFGGSPGWLSSSGPGSYTDQARNRMGIGG